MKSNQYKMDFCPVCGEEMSKKTPYKNFFLQRCIKHEHWKIYTDDEDQVVLIEFYKRSKNLHACAIITMNNSFNLEFYNEFLNKKAITKNFKFKTNNYFQEIMERSYLHYIEIDYI